MTGALFLALAALLAGCGNPVVDDEISALGDEKPGVPPSEYHRPGQPCVLCHGPYEGADPELSLAGTIYATAEEPVPIEGVRVLVTDSVGAKREKRTNCAGNFFWTAEEYIPSFPLKVEIAFQSASGPERRASMGSRIGRDGSCAGCHVGERSDASPGRVFCAPSQPTPPFPVPDAACGVVR